MSFRQVLGIANLSLVHLVVPSYIIHQTSQTAHDIGWTSWLKTHEDWHLGNRDKNIQPPVTTNEAGESDDSGEDDEEELQGLQISDRVSGNQELRNYIASSKTAQIILELCPPTREQRATCAVRRQAGVSCEEPCERRLPNLLGTGCSKQTRGFMETHKHLYKHIM